MNKLHFGAAVKFGTELIRIRDLDPVYVALAEANLSGPELERTLLAYFCLYHLGAASLIAQSKGTAFWDKLDQAAANVGLPRWPRGTERRHWRGQAAVKCVQWFRERYDKPEAVLYNWFWKAKDNQFSSISIEVRKTPSFGPWIAFKVADMMERVLGLAVDFSNCELGIYREPRAGAALLMTGDASEWIHPQGDVRTVIEALLRSPMGRLKAPPGEERRINVQEAETVLCKYKSHCNGHYPLGKDLKEVHEALSDPYWGKSAGKMAKALGRYL